MVQIRVTVKRNSLSNSPCPLGRARGIAQAVTRQADYIRPRPRARPRGHGELLKLLRQVGRVSRFRDNLKLGLGLSEPGSTGRPLRCGQNLWLGSSRVNQQPFRWPTRPGLVDLAGSLAKLLVQLASKQAVTQG